MALPYQNNLYDQLTQDRVCTALGIKLVTSPVVIQLAKLAGFDSVFIDLEHSALSLETANVLCTTSLLAGVTPLVRVPHQCGNGFVQRVLDGGAMGVVFPHIHDAKDAKAAVSICKYPPLGVRSMTGQLAVFSLAAIPVPTVISETNATASTVIVMIEDADAVQKVDEIAQVPGVDVLLVGSNDLSIDLGIPGKFEDQKFRSALTAVSKAAKANGKAFGFAGIYDRPEVQDWAINELGARFVLGQQDAVLLARGAKACASELKAVQKT